MKQNHWVSGSVGTGKTQSIVNFAQKWQQSRLWNDGQSKSVLVFAMNSENRQRLTQRVQNATNGQLSLQSTTPLGFFEEEVMLFWPIISSQEQIDSGFPLRLRPESEQYLAVQLWGEERLKQLNEIEIFSTERWARNLLDLIQLSAFSGVSLEQTPTRLADQWSDSVVPPALWNEIGGLLCEWQRWCFERGLLTYGLISDLYWRYLLPFKDYQQRLYSRYSGLLVDDVENYPAIAKQLFTHCHTLGIPSVYTSNPDFSLRLGLGADPDVMRSLKSELNCQVISLPNNAQTRPSIWNSVQSYMVDPEVASNHLETIESVTRSQLLRKTAQKVIEIIHEGRAQPDEIAIIGPGLDSLARYALTEILEAQNISVISWKEQRSLQSSALVRSLLTLLTFLYKNLGHWISRDEVAEMLSVLSNIDPVRANLIADHCYQPDLVTPSLLDLHQYNRWDRIGSQAASHYSRLQEWINQYRSQQKSLRLGETLSRAIAYFFGTRSLRFDQNTVLRELLETAQHFEQVNDSLQDRSSPLSFEVLNAFLSVMEQGTITANPYPNHSETMGVVLATAYQYRIARMTHRFHFWLDTQSPLWQQGSQIKLWASDSFLSHTTSTVTEDEASAMLLYDLSSRVQEKVFLCVSELSISGQEQI